MSDRDFEIGSRKFKLSKINALKQFHIVRRIAPILGEMAPMLKDLSRVKKSEDSMSEDDKLEQIAKFISPMMNGMSKLSDQDSNLVLMGLLCAVEVQQSGGNWAPIARGDNLMFEDLELPVLLNAAGRSFMYNMAGFFTVLPQVS